MVVTRSQGRNGVKEAKAPPPKKKETTAKAKTEEGEPEKKKQRQAPRQEGTKGGVDQESKREEEEKAEEAPLSASASSKVHKLVSQYGSLPFDDSELAEPETATAETVFAHVLDALIKSTRISHGIADQTVRCLIKAGYQDVQKLKSSSWEERTQVLTEGGYTRYREKTATELGDLAEWVIEEYDGDLNNLRKKTSTSLKDTRNALKQIKGVGDVGVDIFFDSIQHLWTEIVPWLAPRSLETAERIGIGKNTEDIYAAIGNDAREMCKLSRALEQVRLDKKEKEFE